jgi:hypothetical protein
VNALAKRRISPTSLLNHDQEKSIMAGMLNEQGELRP